MVPQSVSFLNVKLSLITREELKEHLIQTIYDKGKFRVLFLDERKIWKSLFSPELRKVINDCDIVLCASQTVAWMCKLFTGKKIGLIMPVTVFLDFLRSVEEMGYTVFLYGGNKVVHGETVKRIRKSFPNARIMGSYPSEVKGQELEDVMTTIRKSQPQVLFLSLGNRPQSEIWISENIQYFPMSIVVSLDSAFKVISGKERMPPLSFQQKGWYGLYRFLTTPYDMARNFRIISLFFVALYRKLFKKAV